MYLEVDCSSKHKVIHRESSEASAEALESRSMNGNVFHAPDGSQLHCKREEGENPSTSERLYKKICSWTEQKATTSKDRRRSIAKGVFAECQECDAINQMH